MKNMLKKRWLAVTLVITMIFGNLTGVAFAEKAEQRKAVVEVESPSNASSSNAIMAFEDFDPYGLDPMMTIQSEMKDISVLGLPETIDVLFENENEYKAIPVSWECSENFYEVQLEEYVFDVQIPDTYRLEEELEEDIEQSAAVLPWIRVVIAEAEPLKKTVLLGNQQLSNPTYGGNEDGNWEGDYIYFGLMSQGGEVAEDDYLYNMATVAIGDKSRGVKYVNGYKYKDGNVFSPIKWRVLNVGSEEALLLSDEILTTHNWSNYQTVGNPTWETSTLREWLNDTFLDEVFTEEEQDSIIEEYISNYNTATTLDGGADTLDKIFVPSHYELTNPLYGFTAGTPSKTRIAKYIKDIYQNLTLTSSDYCNKATQTCVYWTRNPGNMYYDMMRPCLVALDGGIKAGGTNYYTWVLGIRPALNLDIDSECWSMQEDDDIFKKGMAFTAKEIEMKQGGTERLDIEFYNYSVDPAEITWASSKEEIVSVSSDGLIKAEKPGVAYVTAFHGNTASCCKITVKEADIVLTNQQYGVFVYDVDTSVPLAGAKVIIDGIGAEYTNEEGFAIFNITENATKDILVSQDAYNQLSKNNHPLKQGVAEAYEIIGGTLNSIAMERDYSGGPIITSIVLNGPVTADLMNDYFEFNTNPGKISKDPVTFEVRVEAAGAMAYQLIQDNKVVDTSYSGAFTLTAYEIFKNTGVYYATDDLIANKRIYVQAISETGGLSKQVLTGIKVNAPVSYDVNSKDSISLFRSMNYTVPSNIPFIGGHDYNMGLKNIPFDVEIDEDEKKVKIAINKKDTESFADVKDKFIKGVARNGYAKEFNEIAWTTGADVKPLKFKVCGYGEGYYDESGELILINVDIAICAEGSVSYTQYFAVSAVPVYVKVNGKWGVTPEVLLKMEYDESGKWTSLRPDGNKLTGELSLTLSGGVGISGAISAGAEGKATLEGSWESKKAAGTENLKAKVSGEASLFAEAFIFKAELEIANYSKVVYENEVKSNMLKSAAFNYADEAAYTLMDRSYLSNNANLKAFRSLSANNVVKSVVFENSKPRMIKAGDKYYYFWLDDDGSKTSANRTTLVYMSSIDGVTWSSPISVTQNVTTADLDYDIAVEDNLIYILCQETADALPDTITVTDLVAESQLKLITINTDNGVISLPLVVSDKGAILPAIAVRGGTILAAWYENSENDIFGLTGTHYINARICEGGNWSDIKELVNSSQGVVNVDAGCIDNELMVAYVLDQDNDIYTSEDREVYLTKMDKTSIRLTDDSETDSNPRFFGDNQDLLAWYHDGNIMYMEHMGEIASAFETSVDTLTDQFVLLPDMNTIVWKGSVESEEDVIKSVIYAIDLQGDVKEPYILAKTDGCNLRYLSGCINDSGEYLLGFSQLSTAYEVGVDDLEGITQLCVLKTVPQSKVQFIAATFDSNAAEPGQILPLTIAVGNIGGTTINTIDVEIGGFSTTLTNLNIKPGESEDLIVEFEVPAALSGLTEFTVALYPNGEGELEEEATGSFVLGDTDIAVTASSVYLVDSVEYVDVTVTNRSKITANDVSVKILKNANDGDVVEIWELVDISGGDSQTFTFTLNDELADVTVLYAVAGTSSDELILLNNTELICVNVRKINVIKENDSQEDDPGEDDPQDVTYTLQIQSNSHGKIVTGKSGSYKAGTAISIKAEADKGYVFNGWKCSDGGIFADSSKAATTFTMPANNTTVIATFQASGGIDSSGDSGGSKTTGAAVTGQWIRDAVGWWYKNADGTWLAGKWMFINQNWYYFNQEGYMLTGWFMDADGRKYYLNPVSGDQEGAMITGWYLIADSWYYFNTVSDGYKGALLTDTMTPDGYKVNAEGIRM